MHSIYYKTAKVLSCVCFALFSQSIFAHSGSSTNAAWEVCEEKKKSAQCEYKGYHEERYIGSCQLIASKMMCIRNQPIQPAVGKPEKLH